MNINFLMHSGSRGGRPEEAAHGEHSSSSYYGMDWLAAVSARACHSVEYDAATFEPCEVKTKPLLISNALPLPMFVIPSIGLTDRQVLANDNQY